MRAGFCNSCQGWLGATSENDASRGTKSEEALSECVSTTRMIGDMLAVAPLLKSSISKEHSASVFSKNANQLPPYCLQALAGITGIRASVMSNLMRGDHKIRLSILIRACKAFGLSIPNFLNGKEADASAPIWTVSPRVRTRTQLVSLLQTALHDSTCPSVAELSRQLGYKSPNSLRAASPELCKKITAKNKENVSSNHKKTGTNYQPSHVSVILSEALREEPPPTVKEVSLRSGYGSEVLFRGIYQDITKSLMERRAEYLKTECSVIEDSLHSVLKEEPPPSLEEVCSRLTYKGKPFNSTKYLMVKFRSLGHAIRARHAAVKAIEDERNRRAIFEAALVEEPPPCVRDLIPRMNCTRRTLYKNFPNECKQVASRYLQHHKGKLRKKNNDHLTSQLLVGKLTLDKYPTR
jgi:transcriptional regulator with XRE-family HTH domain